MMHTPKGVSKPSSSRPVRASSRPVRAPFAPAVAAAVQSSRHWQASAGVGNGLLRVRSSDGSGLLPACSILLVPGRVGMHASWSDARRARGMHHSPVLLPSRSLCPRSSTVALTAGWYTRAQNNYRGGGLYVAYNTSHLPVVVTLPRWGGLIWQQLVDTSRPAPCDVLVPDERLSEEEAAAGRAVRMREHGGRSTSWGGWSAQEAWRGCPCVSKPLANKRGVAHGGGIPDRSLMLGANRLRNAACDLTSSR
eukprot:364007-Chlamydomonas_euryale.AAC.7